MIRAALVLGGLAYGLAGTSPNAQSLTGSVSQGVEIDSNFDLDPDSPGTSARSTTSLGVTYLTETRNQSFQLSSETSIQVLNTPDDGTETEFTLPSLTARYTREAARAQLEVGAQLRQDPVSFLRPGELAFNDDGSLLVLENLDDLEGTGTRLRYGADATLTLGVGGPQEWRTSLSFARTEFDAASSTLNDTETYAADTEFRLRLSPVVTGVLSADAARFKSEDDTTRDTYAFGAGIDYEISPLLSANAGLGYSLLETQETGGTTRTSGVTADLGIGYQLRNTDLSATAGVESAANGDLVATGAVSLSIALPDGTLNAGLDRSLSFGDDGDQVADTAARFAYTHAINSLSSGDIGLTYFLREDLDDESVDNVTRVSLGLGYQRALTERVDLSLGYTYRLLSEGDEDANSHSVSMNLVVPFDF